MHPRSSLPVLAIAILLAGCGARPAAEGSQPEAYHPSVTANLRLRTAVTAAGQPIVFPAPVEMAALDVSIPAGAETGWHHHPQPGFAYVISGELEVATADGAVHRYKAGDAFAEVVGLAHNGRALGAQPVHLIAWFSAAPGAPLTVKEPAAPPCP